MVEPATVIPTGIDLGRLKLGVSRGERVSCGRADDSSYTFRQHLRQISLRRTQGESPGEYFNA
jgi:hypothetical protein